MATNKNATLRYLVLDRCFSNNGKRYFMEDLLDACNHALSEYNGKESQIHRRQLFSDIKFMKSEAGWSAPIESIRDGKKTFYRYSDRNYSINQQPLNEVEMVKLKEAIQVLSRFEGLPQFDWIHELSARLLLSSQPEKTNPIISFDENKDLEGKEHIGTLFNAILYKKVLKITYQDFKSEDPYDFTIHPYYLKQYNRRWFLAGYNQENNVSTWTLALDRIKHIIEIQTPYKANNIDWDDYYYDFIGVTRPDKGKPTKIKIWVHPESAPYIRTKPLHGTQKMVSQDASGSVITIEIIPNYEFYQNILQYGHRIKILSPHSVVNNIKQILKEALDYYD